MITKQLVQNKMIIKIYSGQNRNKIDYLNLSVKLSKVLDLNYLFPNHFWIQVEFFGKKKVGTKLRVGIKH